MISIEPSSSTQLSAVGTDESIVPVADPECATVIPAPVTAVPPISKVIAALPPLSSL